VDPVLQRLVHAARELGGARYAALGIPDGEGAFARFISSGMSDELIAAMGPLPRTHGLLGAMLTSPEPYRTGDIRADPRFRGWWPSAHPLMRSFLGVPIVARGEIIGALYLTDKEGDDAFSEEDQRLIVLLAAHAAIAIANARLHERSRELSIVEERNRLARELHDSVTQKLFGVTLTAEAAATMIDRDTTEAKAQLRRLQELTREAMEELRSLIFELRPPEAESEGLATALRKHVDVLQSVHGDAVALSLEGDAEPRTDAAEVLRIAQEALQNALRHAHARRVDIRLDAIDGHLRVAVADDGVGFDPDEPGLRSRRLGLTSMEERARALGGTLSIDSRPGVGTTVVLEVPR
jgi:signal transduction histidine kinase